MEHMNESQLRELSRQLASLREQGAVLGLSYQRIWMWQRGAANLTETELKALQSFLRSKVAERIAILERATSL